MCGFLDAVAVVAAVALYQLLTLPYRTPAGLWSRLRPGAGTA